MQTFSIASSIYARQFIVLSCCTLLFSGLYCESTEAYRLADTGQSECYDDVGNEIACPNVDERFYGQDANYSPLEPAFCDNGDFTVTDLNTGLMWEQMDAQNDVGVRHWQSAFDYCAMLSLGGYNDWRLPGRRELMSIIDYGRVLPSNNNYYFPNCRSASYWSESIYAPNPLVVWLGYFNYGQLYWSHTLGSNYVRCVRGDRSPTAFIISNGDGTVKDTVTGLVWQEMDDGIARSWEEALDYCEGLDYADRTDWRLPNVRELESIVDVNLFTPSIDPAFGCNSDAYWSSTTYANLPDKAWATFFNYGYVAWYSKSNEYYVRCVRGGLVGSLRVVLSPQGAIDAGAKWRVSGSDWKDSNDTMPELKPGDYTVEFKQISGWMEPENKTITIAPDQTTAISGTYRKVRVMADIYYLLLE